MSAFCLVNGVVGAGLDPLDRGLHYGDGVFRSLRVSGGRPCLWEEQLDRFAVDAARLGLDFPEASLWRRDLAQLEASLAGGVLKLLLTRGGGQRGYRLPDAPKPCRMLIYDPAPPQSDAWPMAGLNLRLCELRLGAQPRLAGVKHLNRLENVLARAEWNDPAIHEGLLRDEAGRVISGVMSNVLFWRGDCLCTPCLDRCGVAGLTRARLMRRAAAAGYAVRESEFGLDEVLAADELMVCNSVIGLHRVASLGEHTWSVPAISTQLRTLLDA